MSDGRARLHARLFLNSLAEIIPSLATLIEDHERYEEALRFYANRATWVDDSAVDEHGVPDDGARARAALNLERH